MIGRRRRPKPLNSASSANSAAVCAECLLQHRQRQRRHAGFGGVLGPGPYFKPSVMVTNGTSWFGITTTLSPFGSVRSTCGMSISSNSGCLGGRAGNISDVAPPLWHPFAQPHDSVRRDDRAAPSSSDGPFPADQALQDAAHARLDARSSAVPRDGSATRWMSATVTARISASRRLTRSDRLDRGRVTQQVGLVDYRQRAGDDLPQHLVSDLLNSRSVTGSSITRCKC